ncbi:MAG: hypothetical protein ABL951_08880 [Alphaproteobacteria bacterium]
MNKFIRCLMFFTAFALAGCNGEHQPPLPYAVMPRDANLLNAIVNQAGVEVSPPEGLPADSAIQVAKALAEALQENDIPAVMGQKLAGAHTLKGAVRLEPGAIVVSWSLYDPKGVRLGNMEARDSVAADRGADITLAPNVIQALTAQAVAAISPYFPATAGAHGNNLRFFIPEIAGVPGDGGKSLPLALGRALRAAGLSEAPDQDPEAIRIEGQVTLSELNAASMLVKLSWRVAAADGSEIGRIDQSNPVSRRRLDGNWGDVAYGAAAGAAEGIIPLLQDYQARPPAASGTNSGPAP